MAEHIDVVIKCPCGAHLETRSVPKGKTSKSKWNKTCKSCKQTIVCEFVGTRAFTSVKK